jgi:catechol 2,3-dioxygenase-like lactoylglutathione lyase family enzyme
MTYLLNRIIIFVCDVPACAAFYRDHFNLHAVGDWSDEWAELTSADGGCRLAFHRARTDGKPVTHPTGSANHPHKIVFHVDDVDAARAELVAQGVKMGEVWRVAKIPGLALCDGTDIEGHRFQISTRA